MKNVVSLERWSPNRGVHQRGTTVDEIWLEHKCSGKVNPDIFRILLKKLISTEIISILCNFDPFW